MPDRWTNCLSEAYKNQQGEPDLELKVVTININDEHNEELMEQCKILGEYAQYVEIVRKNAEAMSLDVAVQNAVDECIQKGILEDFLSDIGVAPQCGQLKQLDSMTNSEIRVLWTGWGRTPCRENKETKFVLKVF